MKNVDNALIRQLADLLKESDLSEIEIQREDFRIRVARTLSAAPSYVAQIPMQGIAAPSASNDVPAETAVTAAHPGAVCSPMVGNLFTAPRPGAPAFIKPGDVVTPGQTLFIVEAMKVMNPIPSPKGGTVKQVLVSDGQPVEYNEVLAIIE